MGSITPTPGNQITRSQEVIRTTGGLKIVLADLDSSITLDTNLGTSVIINPDGITIDAQGASIRIEGGRVTISAGLINLDASIVTARVIRCDTIIAGMVMGAAYTPGAGNVW